MKTNKIKDITVKVTQKNIIDGVPSNSKSCAIALAVMDALPDFNWDNYIPAVDSDGSIYICKGSIIKDKVCADIRKFSIEVDSDTRYDLDDFIYNYDSDLIEQDEIVECKPWKFDGELNEVIYD